MKRGGGPQSLAFGWRQSTPLDFVYSCDEVHPSACLLTVTAVRLAVAQSYAEGDQAGLQKSHEGMPPRCCRGQYVCRR